VRVASGNTNNKAIFTFNLSLTDLANFDSFDAPAAMTDHSTDKYNKYVNHRRCTYLRNEDPNIVDRKG